MVHLMDEILLNIFDMLPLQDQMNATEACPRFEQIIVHTIWRKKYTKLTFAYGKMIKPTEISKDLVIEFVQLNAMNIKEINISGFTAGYMIVLFRHKMPNLTNLYIGSVINYREAILKRVVKNCENLEKLYIIDQIIDPKCIIKMKNLRELRISDCGVTVSELRMILEHLPLRLLDVSRNDCEEYFETDAKLHTIEELFVSEMAIDSCFAKALFRMTSLKTLHVEEHADVLQANGWLNFMDRLSEKVKSVRVGDSYASHDIMSFMNLPKVEKLTLDLDHLLPFVCLDNFTKLKELTLYAADMDIVAVAKNNPDLEIIRIQNFQRYEKKFDSLVEFLKNEKRHLTIYYDEKCFALENIHRKQQVITFIDERPIRIHSIFCITIGFF